MILSRRMSALPIPPLLGDRGKRLGAGGNQELRKMALARYCTIATWMSIGIVAVVLTKQFPIISCILLF